MYIQVVTILWSWKLAYLVNEKKEDRGIQIAEILNGVFVFVAEIDKTKKALLTGHCALQKYQFEKIIDRAKEFRRFGLFGPAEEQHVR